MAETHRDDIAKLEALYAENPEGRVFIHLAEAYRRAGELDRALEVVKDGISRYAEDSSAHVVLGRVLEDRQQDEEAAAAFRQVLELDAHNLVALRGLGDLAFRAGNHKAALEYFERLAELEPPDGELESLIEALRSGPAGMEEALQQWEEVEPAPQAEAVDFAGGTLGDGGAVEPEAPAGEAEPASEAAGEEGRDVEEEPWAQPAAEESAAPAAEEEVFVADQDAMLPEPEALESSDAQQPADEGEALSTAEQGRDDDVGIVEGLQPQDGLLGAEAAEEAEALSVTERDFHEDAPSEEEIPEIGGMEGLRTSDSPMSGEALRDDTWAAEGEAEEEAAEATQTVFTETMAQVYARQGLYDRAADVYRELLRQRPGDATLETRLAEMEELDAGAGTAEEVPGAVAPDDSFPFLDAPPASAPDADMAEPAEEPWAPEYAAEPEPAVERELASEPETAWEPEAAGEPVSGQAPEPEEEPATAEAGEAAPFDAPASYEEAPERADEEEFAAAPGFGTSPEPADVDESAMAGAPDEVPEAVPADMTGYGSESSYAGEEEPSEASPAEDMVEDVESVWTGASGAVAGEDTPYTWTEAEEREEPAGEGIRSYLLRLAGWSSGGSITADSGAPESEAQLEPETRSGSGAPQEEVAEAGSAVEADASREPGDADAAAGAGGAPSGDDDDLDMFRAWLESLKR